MIRREKTKRSQTAAPISVKPSVESLQTVEGQDPTPSRSSSNDEIESVVSKLRDAGENRTGRNPRNSPPSNFPKSANRFDDTPGRIPGSRQADLDCQTPPPSRGKE